MSHIKTSKKKRTLQMGNHGLVPNCERDDHWAARDDIKNCISCLRCGMKLDMDEERYDEVKKRRGYDARITTSKRAQKHLNVHAGPKITLEEQMAGYGIRAGAAKGDACG